MALSIRWQILVSMEPQTRPSQLQHSYGISFVLLWREDTLYRSINLRLQLISFTYSLNNLPALSIVCWSVRLKSMNRICIPRLMQSHRGNSNRATNQNIQIDERRNCNETLRRSIACWTNRGTWLELNDWLEFRAAMCLQSRGIVQRWPCERRGFGDRGWL